MNPTCPPPADTSMHTWPELGYAAVDIFTCGDIAMPTRACERLAEAFRPQRHELRQLDRGTAVASEPALA